MEAAVVRGSVAVGVDGSSGCAHAIAWATRQAGLLGRPLLLVHAAGPPGIAESVDDLVSATPGVLVAGRAVLDEACREARSHDPDIPLETLVESATPTQLLVDVAEQADMVVVGNRGRGAVLSLVLGSVSETVAARAHRPVVVVRPGAEDAVVRTPGHVVVGVEGREESLAAVAFAFRQASLEKRPLTVVHTFWDRASRHAATVELLSRQEQEALTDEEESAVAETLAGFDEEFPDVQARVAFMRGHPAKALVEASKDAAMVVVGGRSHGPHARLLPGSIGRHVLEHAHCPVAVVRP